MTEKPIISNALREALLAIPGPTCLAAEINHCASLVLKADEQELNQLRGPHTVAFRSEAGLFDTGAVIHWIVQIFDGPQPFEADTFLNPADPDDLYLLRLLETQADIDLHLIDLNIQYLYSKRIVLNAHTQHDAHDLLDQAIAHNQLVSSVHNYGQALADMRARAMLVKSEQPDEDGLARLVLASSPLPATDDIRAVTPALFVKYFRESARSAQAAKTPRLNPAATKKMVTALMKQVSPEEGEAILLRILTLVKACSLAYPEPLSAPIALLELAAAAPLSRNEFLAGQWWAVQEYLRTYPKE